jgi:hypothetical protein
MSFRLSTGRVAEFTGQSSAHRMRVDSERLDALGLDADTNERILWRNAVEVYRETAGVLVATVPRRL